MTKFTKELKAVVNKILSFNFLYKFRTRSVYVMVWYVTVIKSDQ